MHTNEIFLQGDPSYFLNVREYTAHEKHSGEERGLYLFEGRFRSWWIKISSMSLLWGGQYVRNVGWVHRIILLLNLLKQRIVACIYQYE